MFVKLATECATKEGASKGDIDELVAHKPASTTAGKCLRACIFESVGIVSLKLIMCSFKMKICLKEKTVFNYSSKTISLMLKVL